MFGRELADKEVWDHVGHWVRVFGCPKGDEGGCRE